MISPVSTSTILSSRTCPPMRKGRPRKGAPTLLAVQVGIAGTLDGSRVLAELVAPLGDGSGNPLHAEEITNPRVSEVRILEGVGNGLLLAVRVDGPGELVVAVHQIDDTPGPTLVGGNPVGLGNDLALDLVTLLLQLAEWVVLVVDAVRVGRALPALDGHVGSVRVSHLFSLLWKSRSSTLVSATAPLCFAAGAGGRSQMGCTASSGAGTTGLDCSSRTVAPRPSLNTVTAAFRASRPTASRT